MAEDKFLAFKGLKQYDPDSGWASVDSNASNSEHREDMQQSYQSDQEERVHDLYIDPDFEQDFNDLSLSSHSNYQQSTTNSSNDRGHHSFNEYPHPRDSEINARANRSFKDNTQDELNLSDPLLSELFPLLSSSLVSDSHCDGECYQCAGRSCFLRCKPECDSASHT